MLALLYTYVEDYLDRRGPLREEHLGLIRAAHERGDLEQAGPFSDNFDRALITWSTDDESRVAAFVEADPYVREGLVVSWSVHPWATVIG